MYIKELSSFGINNSLVKPEIVKPTSEDISFVVDSIVPKLSQIKIAHGNSKIEAQINVLNAFIDSSEEFFESLKNPVAQVHTANEIGKINLTAGHDSNDKEN